MDDQSHLPADESRPSDRHAHGSALAPFRIPVFRELWAANVVSTIGGYINDVGAAWLMTSLSPSPLMVALIQFASNAPFFLLSLPGGALGDVLNKRKLLLAAQGLMTVLSAALGLMTLLGFISPVTLLVMLFVIEIFDAISGPAWQTLIPEIVGPKELRGAITLNSVGMNVARALGPAIGGALLAVTKTSGPAFLVNAASFAGVLAFLYRWKHAPRPTGLPAERLAGAMRVGLRYVRYSLRFRATLVRIGSFMLFGSSLATLLPIISRSVLNRGPGSYGVLLGFMGAGAVAAVPVLHKARRKLPTDVLMAVATLACGLVLAAIGAIRVFPILCLLMFIAGIAWITVMSSMNSAAQSVLPGWVRARAMSVYLMVFFGAMTLGSFVWGVVATRYGAPIAMGISGVGMLATLGLIIPYRVIDHDKVDLTPSLHWPAPTLAHMPAGDRGPVLITVQYQVDPAKADRFVKSMQRMRRQRLRTGAFRWGLFTDAADPTRYVETFLTESWAEHMRQHTRLTAADREVEQLVHSLHLGPDKPVVSHLIHCDLDLSPSPTDIPEH